MEKVSNGVGNRTRHSTSTFRLLVTTRLLTTVFSILSNIAFWSEEAAFLQAVGDVLFSLMFPGALVLEGRRVFAAARILDRRFGVDQDAGQLVHAVVRAGVEPHSRLCALKRATRGPLTPSADPPRIRTPEPTAQARCSTASYRSESTRAGSPATRTAKRSFLSYKSR